MTLYYNEKVKVRILFEFPFSCKSTIKELGCPSSKRCWFVFYTLSKIRPQVYLIFAREVEPLVKAKYPGIQRLQFNQAPFHFYTTVSSFSSFHDRKQLEQTLKPSTCRCWGSFGPPCPRRRRRITRGRRKDKKGRKTNGKLRTAMLRTLEGWMWVIWRLKQNHGEIFLINQLVLINQTEKQNRWWKCLTPTWYSALRWEATLLWFLFINLKVWSKKVLIFIDQYKGERPSDQEKSLSQLWKGGWVEIAGSAQTEYCSTFNCLCVGVCTGVTSHVSHIY